MRKVNIFLDTNVIEIQNKKLFEFKFNNVYGRLKRFITYNGYNNFKIIIPQIVLDEIYKHYIEEYKNIQEKIDNLDDGYNSIKSDLVKVGYDINIIKNRYSNVKEYEDYLKSNFNKYISQEKGYMEILPYPSQDKFYSIIERAIQKKRPFFFGGINNKKFSDAGFKDVVILESIKEKMEKENSEYIIATNDNIFNGLNWNDEIKERKGKATSAKSDTDIIDFICKECDLRDLSEYIEFSRTEYFSEKVSNALGKSIVRIENAKFEECEDNNVVIIKCKLEDGKNINVILDETKEFINIANESDEIIFQW